MNAEKYKSFQDFQNDLFFFADSKFLSETEFGNILFQQMSSAAFEVFSKFEAEPKNKCPQCGCDE